MLLHARLLQRCFLRHLCWARIDNVPFYSRCHHSETDNLGYLGEDWIGSFIAIRAPRDIRPSEEAVLKSGLTPTPKLLPCAVLELFLRPLDLLFHRAIFSDPSTLYTADPKTAYTYLDSWITVNSCRDWD